MKTVAMIEVDPERNGRGLRTRAFEPLGGVPALARVIARAGRVPGIARVIVAGPPAGEPALRALADPLGAEVVALDPADLSQRGHLRRRRIWGAQGWRGGIGGGFAFEEEGNPRVLAEIAARSGADAVLVCSPAAPLFDPDLATRILANLARTDRPVNASFAPVPPGLAPWALTAGLAADLARAQLALGEAMDLRLRAAGAVLDIALQRECVSTPLLLTSCLERFTWDSDHQVRFVAGLWEALGAEAEGASAEDWVRAAAAAPDLACGAWPRDLEIELTPESPVACRACLQGHAALNRGGAMDRALAERLLDQAADHDDVRVTLGGTGDPLRHPDVIALVRRARAAGVHGLHVQTQAVDLDAACAGALLDAAPDVISVCLDACTAARWHALKGTDAFDRVRANLEGFLALRARARRRDPLLVVEMVRTRENEEDLEPFYDHWIARADAVVIKDHDPCCGLRADYSPMHLHPPERTPCRRLSTKLTVRADGSVPLCDEDVGGRVPLGDARTQTLEELWSGATLDEVRRAHRERRFGELPLCRECTVWHGL